MKRYLVVAVFFAAITSSAQKAMDEMVAAEKSFAAYASTHSTREAFLQYMDTAAVMFDKGEPLSGFQLWTQREKNTSLLKWWPRFAEISSSGDFGYTAGPWTFQPTKTDSVVASGYFFTIWQKNTNGEWKFILDVGTDMGPMMKDTGVIKISEKTSTNTANTLLDAENKFIRIYREDTAKAYAGFLSAQTILANERSNLVNGISSWRPTPAAARGPITFSIQGSGMAPAGDLGYVYGTASQKGKKETYLRIWRHEATGWKIALQVVRL